MKFSEPAFNPVAYFLHLKLTNLSVKHVPRIFARIFGVHQGSIHLAIIFLTISDVHVSNPRPPPPS
jgi:hypothetical protein